MLFSEYVVLFCLRLTGVCVKTQIITKDSSHGCNRDVLSV